MKSDARIHFARAYELHGEERDAYLAKACGDDVALRLEVDRLLVQAEKADSFFADTAGFTIGADTSGANCAESEGDQVGPYILRQQIGEGGFGTVWMAEQIAPITRMVALKVVKAGMDTRQVLARFEAERQALAMMDHPNIAKVLDAGATASGRPYFAMELVRGIPITQFCDDQKFGPRERLELFKDVCLAVNHAHQKGVIHRDLKPSNVMVTLAADVPVVKVIDFGIAKATQSRLTEKTLFTRFEQFLGTPAYMSPEQAAMSALDIDTRSDIYSLGVLLYELLTGNPPFDQKSLLSAGYDEMRRIIKEDEPLKPSTRLTRFQAWADATGSGRNRYVSPSALKGELDWIVMKAIEKDRARRYETANAFALDIKRFLVDEPVSAAAPSVLYKFRKFARRNKVAFGAGSAIAASVVLGLGIAVLSYSREKEARAEEERLRHEASEARESAEKQTRVALSLKEAYRKQAYQSDMHLASLAHDAGNVTHLNELLDRYLPKPGNDQDFRGFEWFHWWQAAHSHLAQTPVGRPIHHFDISPDYRLFAADVWQDETHVRATSGSQPVIAQLRGAPCLSFSPDGANLILGGNTLSVFDTSTWRSQELPVPGGGAVTCLAFCSGQTLMASGGDQVGIVVWDTKTWEPVGQPLPEDGTVRSLAFTRDGSKLVAALNDSRVVVWDLETRAVERTLSDHGKSVECVVHSPAADLFATGSSDETVRLWNSEFELLGTYDADTPVTHLKFCPDGRKLIGGTSRNNSVLVWDVGQDLPTLDLMHVIKGHSMRITGLGFLADDGNTAMSVSYDGSSKTWDFARYEPSFRLGKVSIQLPTWAEPARMAFTRDGQEILITDPVGKRFGARLDSLDIVALPDPGGFRTLAVDRDETWHAGFTEDGHLAVWNARQGGAHARHPTRAEDVRIHSVVVFPDGPTVAWNEKGTGTVHIWNVKKDTTRSFGVELSGLPDLSSRGDRMAVYRWDRTSVWDVTVDPPVRLWEDRGWGPEFCAVFSPNGRLVATASHNGQVRLYDTESGKLVRKLTGHTDTVQTVTFSRDGSWLVSGGRDHTVRIWDVESGRLLSTLANPDGPVASVALSPAEDSIAALTEAGVLRLFTTATPEEVEPGKDSRVRRSGY